MIKLLFWWHAGVFELNRNKTQKLKSVKNNGLILRLKIGFISNLLQVSLLNLIKQLPTLVNH